MTVMLRLIRIIIQDSRFKYYSCKHDVTVVTPLSYIRSCVEQAI